MDDAILYSSAFDANGGVFEPLLDESCAIISDELNHASIIDGVRLAKAKRFVYRNNDMADLEDQLVEAREARFKLIVTDGVFSMDGIIAQVDKICDLAEKIRGPGHGRRLPRHRLHRARRAAAPTSTAASWTGSISSSTTFGKALGGASGGCVAGRREIIEFLRQRSRPYLFSNSLAPGIAGATVEVLKILEESGRAAGAADGQHPALPRGAWRRPVSGSSPASIRSFRSCSATCPDDARLSQDFANALLEEGIYVIGFSYPVVPVGKSRIRVQLSAAHSPDQIAFALEKFRVVGKRLGAI